jgi:hypothetical protein
MDERRYIIWRPDGEKVEGEPTIKSLLSTFRLQILKASLDRAVVLMDAATEARLRRLLPELAIERDVPHRLV